MSLLLLLLACQKDCPNGAVRKADGLCHLVEEAPEVTGDAPRLEQGEPAASWVELPTLCEAEPAPEPSADPLRRLGGLFLQDYAFAEVIDIKLDVEAEEAWLVGQAGLLVVDISDPSAPELRRVVESPDSLNRLHHLALTGEGTALATHRDFGLFLVDGEDEEEEEEEHGEPGAVRRLVAEEGLSDLLIEGDELWVASHHGDLIRYSIDEHRVREEERLSGLGHVWSIEKVGARIYTASSADGLHVVEQTDEGMVWLGQVEALGGVQDLSVSPDGSALYAAIGGFGVEVYDLSDPDAPLSLGALPTAHSAIGLDAAGGLLWAATQQELVAFDISEPLLPLHINAEQTEQWAMQVAAVDERAFVAEWGWLSAFEAEPSLLAPDLDLSLGQLYLSPEGGSAELRASNLGGAPLQLGGACPSDGRLRIFGRGLEVPPGGQIDLLVELEPGSELEGGIAISSDDPDDPQQQLSITATLSGPGVALGDLAPDFTLSDLDGQSWTLSELQGLPVVLVYFATW